MSGYYFIKSPLVPSTNKNDDKLRGFYLASQVYRRNGRRLSAILVPTLRFGGSVAWSAQRIPTAVNLGFIDHTFIIITLPPNVYWSRVPSRSL
jgi:hypothetical protein